MFREGKAFFFEKKKQKTFAPWRRLTGEVRRGQVKGFCFFHMKEGFA